MPHQNHLDLPETAERLKALAADWLSIVVESERSIFHTWPIRFCEALGVETPRSAIGGLSIRAAGTSRGSRRTRHPALPHLETLALMGEVTLDADGRHQAALKVA